MGAHRGWIAIGSGVAYALLYLWAVGDIDLGGQGWHWQPVALTFERLVAMRGSFHFEAIAMAELGVLFVLVSPGNVLLGSLLGLLLGLNVHGSLALREQAVCAMPASASGVPSTSSRGATASASAGAVPALLAGGACCAPSLLLLLGLPGLGAFVALFAWLIPLSMLLLAASRAWQRRRGAEPVRGL